MKFILCAAFCIIPGISSGEESSRAAWVRSAMESYGWKTEKVTFEEIGKDGQLVVIKRSGEPVGYYFDESVWERRDIEARNLDGVTKIAYGNGRNSNSAEGAFALLLSASMRVMRKSSH